ncbi:MFS general substrate transporter [Peniophora sp. CONT]|nr:MFS general substrate transporter [Peniophora sp. CONT]
MSPISEQMAFSGPAGTEPHTTSSPLPDLTVISVPEEPPHVTRRTDFGFLPIPKHLRHDPARPILFNIVTNIFFAAATTFIVANLDYVDPILIELSVYFKTDYNRIAQIPTLIQGGYGTGLLLICPLGDLVRRRALLLCCVGISTALTVGLCITKSLVVFETLSFLIGMASIVPQIMVPLAADLAPAHRRATAISIVLAGLSLGVLMARVVSGIIAQYTDWRNVYFMALGLQAATLLSLWATVPDYAPKTKKLTYLDIMWSLVTILVTEPQVVQAALIGFCGSIFLTAYWITATFLLGDDPYNYSTFAIGMFGLVGMCGVFMSPVLGIIVDKLVPWWGALYATIALLGCMALYTGAAGVHIAAVVVFMIGLDLFRQLQMVCLTTSVLSIAGEMRARMNALLILSLFIGKVIGSSGGTAIFVAHGWRMMGVWMIGLVILQIILLFARGPHVDRKTWLGWQGGMKYRDIRPQAEEAREVDAEKGPVVEMAEVKGEVEAEERPAVVRA